MSDFFTNYTATGSNVLGGVFQDSETFAGGNINGWVRVLGTMSFTNGTSVPFVPGGPATVTSIDAHLGTQTGFDHLDILNGYSATWDSHPETVTTSGANVYVNNVLTGSYAFSGSDLVFNFAAGNNNPDVLGVVLQAVEYQNSAYPRTGFQEQISFSFGTSSGTVTAPSAAVRVDSIFEVPDVPSAINFGAPAGHTLSGYPNVLTPVFADAGVVVSIGLHTLPDGRGVYSVYDLSAVHVAIANPGLGDQLVITTGPNVVADGNGHYTIAGASVQINAQGTAIDGLRMPLSPTTWGDVLLHAISYTNTSGAPPSSLQISIGLNATPDVLSPTDAGLTPFTPQTFTIDLTALPSVVPETATITSGGAVTATAAVGALAGDSDANSYALAISSVGGAAPGSTVHGQYGDLVLNADGSYAYVTGATAGESANIAAANGAVTDSFSFSVSDGHGGVISSSLGIGLDATHPAIAATEFAFATSQIKPGDSGLVTLDMSSPVSLNTAGGAPSLTLNDGQTAAFDAAHSTATRLVFDYQVGPGATDVAALAVSAVNLNGAIAQNVSNVANASFGLAGLSQAGPEIGPFFTAALASPSSGAFGLGQSVTLLVEMNSAVTVTGATATLSLSNGGVATLDVANTAALSPLGVLAFDYKVAPGDLDTGALSITAINLHGTTVTDGGGLAANFLGTAGTFANVKIETTPPTLSPLGDETVEATGPSGAAASFAATATDVLGGSDPVAFTEGAKVVHSGDVFTFGTHLVTAKATDAAGNFATESFTITVRDTTAPDTSISSGPAALTNSKAATFMVAGSDAVGVSGFQYELDGGAWTAAASTTISLTGLADGAHAFQVRAFDAAGNVDQTPASFNWTVDTVAPAVTNHLASDTGASSSDRITSNPALTGATDPNAVVHFTVDGAAIAATATASAAGAWSFTPSGLADGAHTILASSTGAAGNTGTASLSFTLDTTAPQTQIASLAQNGGSAKATVTFAGQSEAGATILKVVDTQVGGAQIGAVGDGVSTVLATANASGGWSVTSGSGFSYSSANAYKIDVTARDVAGNVSTVSTFIGSTKADNLTGTAGNDFLDGGAKGDTLTGGAGADTFVYKAIGESQPGAGNFDTITDFTHGVDRIDFSAIAGLNTGVQAVTVNLLTATPASIAAHTIDLVTIGGSTTIYANASNSSETLSNSHEDMQINLTGVTTFGASDFLLH
ncbi:MAG: putative internalin [Phenylobacterium sp.]|jgi:VCBS repeat-containing protein|uniref:beta strand repeat-containing protein n=1 Tax=Phenylobacterium sp. TaxID=1871053 RepID=UPI002619CED9|nr:Ig-like domain-containing protein [Phenylobacterium sp.]MDB5498190.1 putative internalin [Phenylobacterium sp.]